MGGSVVWEVGTPAETTATAMFRNTLDDSFLSSSMFLQVGVVKTAPPAVIPALCQVDGRWYPYATCSGGILCQNAMQ